MYHFVVLVDVCSLNIHLKEYEELRVSASFLEIYNEQLKDLD